MTLTVSNNKDPTTMNKAEAAVSELRRRKEVRVRVRSRSSPPVFNTSSKLVKEVATSYRREHSEDNRSEHLTPGLTPSESTNGLSSGCVSSADTESNPSEQSISNSPQSQYNNTKLCWADEDPFSSDTEFNMASNVPKNTECSHSLFHSQYDEGAAKKSHQNFSGEMSEQKYYHDDVYFHNSNNNNNKDVNDVQCYPLNNDYYTFHHQSHHDVFCSVYPHPQYYHDDVIHQHHHHNHHHQQQPYEQAHPRFVNQQDEKPFPYNVMQQSGYTFPEGDWTPPTKVWFETPVGSAMGNWDVFFQVPPAHLTAHLYPAPVQMVVMRKKKRRRGRRGRGKGKKKQVDNGPDNAGEIQGKDDEGDEDSHSESE